MLLNVAMFVVLAGIIWLGGHATLHGLWLYSIDHFSTLVRTGVVPSEAIALPEGQTGDWADAFDYVLAPALRGARRVVDLLAMGTLLCASPGCIILCRTRQTPFNGRAG